MSLQLPYLKEFVAQNPRFVVAHRGASGTAPENTLSAIQEAIDASIPMIEIDVQVTTDNEVILFHDHVIGRTSTGHGSTQTLRYSELKDLDAGIWFGERYQGERIPLLGEALKRMHNKCYVNIEIKPPRSGEDYKTKVDTILEIVQQNRMLPYTLFGSFHHPSIAYLKEQRTEAHTAAIQLPNDKRLPSDITQETGCEAIVCSMRECTHKRTDNAQHHGIYMGVYVINTERDVDAILKHPVQALVSNFPAAVQALVQQKLHSTH